MRDYEASVKQVRAFNRNRRVIAARREYRQAIRAGVPERRAWAVLNTVLDAVRESSGHGEGALGPSA